MVTILRQQLQNVRLSAKISALFFVDANYFLRTFEHRKAIL